MTAVSDMRAGGGIGRVCDFISAEPGGATPDAGNIVCEVGLHRSPSGLDGPEDQAGSDVGDNATCDPSFTDSMSAFIRRAMNRWQSAGMTLSCPESKYQAGRLFQPATLAFSVRAAALSGRWLTAIGAATSAGRSAQDIWWQAAILMSRSRLIPQARVKIYPDSIDGARGPWPGAWPSGYRVCPGRYSK